MYGYMYVYISTYVYVCERETDTLWGRLRTVTSHIVHRLPAIWNVIVSVCRLPTPPIQPCTP